MLIGSQALKARAQDLRDLTFMMEWASVATTLVAMTLGFRMVLGITLVDQAPLGLSVMELVATLLTYPAVVFVSHIALGVRKAAPGDLDAMRAAIMRRPTRDSANSHRRISRRGLIVGGVMSASAAALALRMRFLQVEQADQFRLLADENRINIRLIPPARGRIFDRNGTIIAENVPSYRITLVPEEETSDIEAVIERLGQLVELDPDELNRARRDLERLRGDTPVTVADRVSWEAISRVAVNTPALPGRRARGGAYAPLPAWRGPIPMSSAMSARSATMTLRG